MLKIKGTRHLNSIFRFLVNFLVNEPIKLN